MIENFKNDNLNIVIECCKNSFHNSTKSILDKVLELSENGDFEVEGDKVKSILICFSSKVDPALDEIANETGVNRESAREVHAKLLRIARHPSRMSARKYLVIFIEVLKEFGRDTVSLAGIKEVLNKDEYAEFLFVLNAYGSDLLNFIDVNN